jgi:hypothetical protein
MAKMLQMTTFKHLIKDRELNQTDIGDFMSVSLIVCSVLCVLTNGCTTINICIGVKGQMCQLNRKGGKCLEKGEVVFKTGCRMYQTKVRGMIYLIIIIL